MAWVKIDDGFAFNEKIVEVGNEAAGVFVRALAWCAANLTDGILPSKILYTITRSRGVLSNLNRTKLLVQLPNGDYQVTAYLKYNPSAAKVRHDRTIVAQKRKEAGLKGARNRWAKQGTTGAERTNSGTVGDMANPMANCLALCHEKNGTLPPDSALSDGKLPRPLPQTVYGPVPVLRDKREEGDKTAPQTPFAAPVAPDSLSCSVTSITDSTSLALTDSNDLERVDDWLEAEGVTRLTPKWWAFAAALAPFSARELRAALAEARSRYAGERIGAGLILRIVEGYRADAGKAPKPHGPQEGTEWAEVRRRESAPRGRNGASRANGGGTLGVGVGDDAKTPQSQSEAQPGETAAAFAERCAANAAQARAIIASLANGLDAGV